MFSLIPLSTDLAAGLGLSATPPDKGVPEDWNRDGPSRSYDPGNSRSTDIILLKQDDRRFSIPAWLEHFCSGREMQACGKVRLGILRFLLTSFDSCVVFR